MPLAVSDSVFPPPARELAKFASRRSVVHSTRGIVSCTQPLAAKCGIEVLEAGGNCVVSLAPPPPHLPFFCLRVLRYCNIVFSGTFG